MPEGEIIFFKKLNIDLEQYITLKKKIENSCERGKTCIIRKEKFPYLCPDFKEKMRMMVQTLQTQG